MPSKLYNLAQMATATTGTGTVTLGAASAGFITFAQSGIQNGDSVYYAIKEGNNSEVGIGTYSSTGPTLTRAPLVSTNSNAAITLAGSAVVFITATAEAIATATDYTLKQTVTISSSTASIPITGISSEDISIMFSAITVDTSADVQISYSTNNGSSYTLIGNITTSQLGTGSSNYGFLRISGCKSGRLSIMGSGLGVMTQTPAASSTGRFALALVGAQTNALRIAAPGANITGGSIYIDVRG